MRMDDLFTHFAAMDAGIRNGIVYDKIKKVKVNALSKAKSLTDTINYHSGHTMTQSKLQQRNKYKINRTKVHHISPSRQNRSFWFT
ncbi:hypothetical protein P8452_21257 [Trifolium repens]|nr:hypothetical protein P8452_21257 [Trifolium repens]